MSGVLKSLYEASLKAGATTPDEIKALKEYREGIGSDYHSNIFQETNTKTPKEEGDPIDTADKVDKLTLLTQLRAREVELDNMKKSGGYQGERIDHTLTAPKDTDASLNPQPATTPQIKPIKKFQMVPDAPLAPKPFTPVTPVPGTTDPFGTPITPIINLAPTGLNSGFGIYGNQPMIKVDTITHDEALKKAVPPIIAQRQQASAFDAKLDETFVKAMQNIPTDDVDRFKQEYANQKKVIAGMIEQHKNFTPDIANYNFNESADDVARSSFSSDNAGNIVIPNQKPLKAKLDSSFYANLNAIIQHEKKNGKLADGIKDSDVVDAVMGGEWLWHSFMGGQYSDLAKKYAPFFDKYEQTRDALHSLEGEYQKRGGDKAVVDTPVTKGGQPTGESGELRLKGVKVPESELNWGGNSKRVVGDILQGASNVTFDAAGKVVAGTAGLVGAGYETQKSIQHGFEGAGSKLAGAVNGAVDLLTLKPLWSNNENSTAKDDWHEIMKLFDAAPYVKEGTAMEVSGALQSIGTTEGQQQAAKRSDSAIRDITQTVSEMAMGMYGGDFYMAGKVATGLGKGVMAAKSGVDALRLGMRVEKAEAATLTANRLFKVLEAEGKAGADIVAGTTEGRKAMLMFKALLPKSADATEAAHLATTMMLQTVTQHANNLGIDDIKEGMISGGMFGIMNIGFSKIAGTLAQRVSIFEKAYAKTKSAITGVEENAVRDASELMETMGTRKKVYTLISQMATQPVQTKISEAMTTGNWSKVLDIDEYNNRHAITDMVMGSLGLRDFMHSTKRSQEHRDAYRALYEEQVRSVAAGEKSPMDARKDLINLAIDINKQTQQTGTLETPIAKTKPSGKPITIEKQLAKKGGEDVTARDLTQWVRDAGGNHPLDEALMEFAMGTEGDSKVKFVKGNALADGTLVPGKYNYRDGVKTLTFEKTLTTESGLPDAREELMHNVFNTKIDEPNSPYLREGMNILSKVVQHPEFTKAVEDHFQGDKDMAAEIINKYFNVDNTEGNQGVKEFIAGVGNDYGMKEVLSKLGAGGKKTFLDKAKELLVKMVPWTAKYAKLNTKQKISYLDEYMGLINSARDASKDKAAEKLTDDESGSLGHLYGKVIGRDRVPIAEMKKLDNEDLKRLKVIYDFLGTKANPGQAFTEAFDFIKDAPTVVPELLKDEGISKQLRRVAEQSMVASGRQYDELTPKEKLVAVADALVAMEEKSSDEKLNDLVRIFPKEYVNLYALSESDAEAIKGKYDYAPRTNAHDMLRSAMGLANINQAEKFINELTKHGDADTYYEGMQVLGEKVIGFDASKTEAWNQAVRSIWKSRVNPELIDNLSVTINADGSVMADYIPKSQNRTSVGSIEHQTAEIKGWHTARENWSDMGSKAWFGNGTSQVMVSDMTSGHLIKVHETTTHKLAKDGEVDSKTAEGFDIDKTDDKYSAEIAMLKGATADGQKFFVPKTGNLGGNVVDVTKTVDYVMEDGGKYAVTRLTELNDSNLWHMLNSYALHPDGNLSERYPLLGHYISPTKLQHLVNVKGTSVENLKLNDIIKKEAYTNGYTTKDGTTVTKDELNIAFAKQRETINPMLQEIAKDLAMLHKELNGDIITSYAYRVPVEKQTIDTHTAELLNQLNAFTHWAVDGAGEQYLHTPGKSVPKIQEKYMGLVAGKRYVNYPKLEDALVAMGREKWADKTEDDWSRIHGVQVRNGQHQMDFGILDADALKDDASYQLIVEAFGKSATDGNTVVFHNDHMEVLRNASVVDNADHVKTALYTNENGYMNMHKSDIHFLDIDALKATIEHNKTLPLNEQSNLNYDALIRLADGVKANGMFGLTVSTAMKGKMSYRPAVDKAEGVAYGTKHEPIGLLKSDGTLDTDKTSLDEMHKENQRLLLHGQQVPDWAKLTMNLYGDKSMSFIAASEPNSRTESPGMSIDRAVRSVDGGGKYWNAVKPHLEAFDHNRLLMLNRLTNGYDVLSRISRSREYDETGLIDAGLVIENLVKHVEAKENSEFSGVDAAYNMAKDLRAALTPEGKLRPEALPGLMLHEELFFGQKNLVQEMIAQKGRALLDGKDVGATAVVMPDFTGMADFVALRKYVSEKEAQREADGTVFYHEGEVDKYKEFFNEETGTYADGSQGVTLSRDIIEKLSRELRRSGLPELTLGSKVFLKVTPADDVSSFAPFILTGLTETRNTIIANKEFMLSVSGKDFDGDAVGIFADSPNWRGSDNVDNFGNLHKELTAMQMHRGPEKQGQGNIMDAAIKFTNKRSDALPMIKLADGNNISGRKVPLSPLHPDHSKFLTDTSRDIGIVVRKINNLAMAFQNSIKSFEPDANGHRVLDHGFSRTIGGKEIEGSIRYAYMPELMGNYSLIKQLGAVDMFVPHGINMDDLFYGTFIKGAEFNGTFKPWSSLDGQDRRTVIDEADRWIKRISGTSVSQIIKGESVKPDAIDEHTTYRTSAESIFAKAIDSLNGYGTNSIQRETGNRFNQEFEVSRRSMDLKYRKKVDEVVDIVSPVLRFIVQKPNEINHRNNNYVSSLRADYYMFSDPIAKTPQSDLYRTAMVTNLYFGAVNSKDNQVVRQTHPASKYLTIASDNKGMFFEYRDAYKNIVTKHLREVIRQDGTIEEGFVEDMKRMGTNEAVLFHPLVLNSLEVPPLSLSEANFLLGANLANIGKKLEAMDTRNNADSFVATAMMSQLGTKLTKDGLFEGTFLSHSIPTEKLTEDITEATSNPLRVIAGAEAYGVIPTMKDGGLLKEFVKNTANQGYENLPRYDESGAFFYRQKEYRKATKFIAELFPNDKLDIENPEHLKVLQEKLPKKMEELYGNMIRPKDMPELLDGISSYLASDFSNRLARDNAEHAPTQTFLAGLAELDASFRKHRPSIKEAGGWQAWVQNVTRDGLQHVSMFEDTSRSSMIDKTADNVFILNKDHEIGVDVEMDQDGVRKVVPIKAGDMYTTTTLLPIVQRLASRARWNIVEPHRIIKKAIDTNAGHLQQSVDQAKRIFSQGKGEYKAPDMMPVIEAMQGGFFPDFKVDVVGKSTSSMKEATLRITKTLEDGTIKIFDIDPNKDFNKKVESMFDEGSFIKKEGLHSVFARYASNIEPGTSNLHERRQFITEVGQFPTEKGMVPVQGEAFLQAREHARDNGEDLHLFDIASKQWHTLNPDGNLAQGEAPLTGIDPNKLHITSKLENHLVLSEQEYHNVVDDLLKQYNITPGSRSEKVEDTVREVADPNLAGKEKDIIQGYKAMLIGIIEGTKRSMTEAEFGAGMEHFMSKHNVESHMQKWYVDTTETLRHQQENRNINKGTGTDYKGVIADMAKVDIRKGGEALQEMERYLRATQDDDVHWENLASAMFHHDTTAPEGVSREELSRQVSQIKSAFNREIRTLKQKLGASEARVIGNESSRKTKDVNPISLIDILSVMGRRDLLDINLGNLFERNGQAAGIMHTINDTIATSIYHQNRDANEVAHLNILDSINTSKEKGVIPTVREDMAQIRNHANENRNVKSFNTLPPGTLMDIIITDANGDKRLIQDASYMSTGNFNVVDKVNGTSSVLPHFIVMSKKGQELMSINLDAIDQITSSSVHAKEYEANAYMKQMSNSPELRGAIDGFIDATPLYTTGTGITTSKTPFKNTNQVFTTHRNIEEKPLSFFNQIRSVGEFYQVASSYLKGNTFVGSAAAIAMNPGKAGKELTKLAVGVVWPQLQNFTGAVTSITKLSPYSYAHLVKFNEVVDGKKKFVTWDGDNNPIYKMLNTKTGLLSLTKQYSAVLSDPSIGDEIKNALMRRVQSGEVGNLAAFLADNGVEVQDRTRPRPIKAYQQHQQAARLEKIQKDLNESLTLIEKSRQGIFDIQQPVLDAIADNLERDGASVHIIDGRAVVSVDGKSVDKLKTDMLSYHQQLAGITSGVFLQHTEVISAGMASQINANNATDFVPKFHEMDGFQQREFIESIAKLTLGDYEYSVGQYSGLSRSFNLFKKYGENKNFYQQQGWAERKEVKKGIETVLGKGTSKDAAIGQGMLIDPKKQMSTWVTHGLAWKILRTLAFAAAAPGSVTSIASKVIDDTVQANPLVAVLSALWQILYEEAGTKNTMENIRPVEAGIKNIGNSVSQGLGGRAVVDVAAAGTQAMVDYGKYLLYQEDLSNLEKQKQTEALVGLGKGVSNVFPATSFLSTGFSAVAPVVKK